MNIDKVSEKFSLSKDTLRYWEKRGLLPPVKRDEHGYRNYSDYDQNWIFYIKVLREAGVSIKTLQDFVRQYRAGKLAAERKKLLQMQLAQLQKQANKLQKTINYLSFKVDHFDDHLLTFENEKLAYDKKLER